MKDCKPSLAPINKGDKFSKYQYLKNDVKREFMKEIPYKGDVGSLMYLAVCIRPNIAFSTCVLRRYLANPGYNYWVVVANKF